MNLFDTNTINQIETIQKRYAGKSIGFTCSCFDLLHTGHLIMLQDAKNHCDVLVVGLHTDPTIDRPDTKNKPIQSFYERELMIRSIKYIDEVIVYETEDDLYHILQQLKPSVRTIGSDWKGHKFTGWDIADIPIHWHERTHSYSTTNLRKRIYAAEKAKEK